MRRAAAVLLVACSTSTPPPGLKSTTSPSDAAMPAVAPAPVPVPAELAGKWRAAGTLGGDGGHGMSWYAEYTFRPDGTFLMTGYPPISVEGRVAVTGREDRRLHIVLTQRKMGASDWPDLDRWGELAADGQTLHYDDKTFHRQP
jgi:hypothetical protein